MALSRAVVLAAFARVAVAQPQLAQLVAAGKLNVAVNALALQSQTTGWPSITFVPPALAAVLADNRRWTDAETTSLIGQWTETRSTPLPGVTASLGRLDINVMEVGWWGRGRGCAACALTASVCRVVRSCLPCRPPCPQPRPRRRARSKRG
jgi:hypothetical protein